MPARLCVYLCLCVTASASGGPPKLAARSEPPEGATVLTEDSPEIQAWHDELAAEVEAAKAENAYREAQPVRFHTEGPRQLDGQWMVSLCVAPGRHAWLRFESADTGRVFTISKYKKGAGRSFNVRRLRMEGEAVPRSGVWFNREAIPYGHTRNYAMLTTLVEDPEIYLGDDEGETHRGVRSNCVTYTRDAWAFYTGERYDLPAVHEPSHLAAAIAQKHPQVLRQRASR